MSIRKNKKGFTLVELLAVIVILALIMSIAIVSMTGIMENARYSTFNDTARSIISGVRSQLLAANELRAGDYYFTGNILQNTGSLPFGGSIKFAEASGTEIGTGIYRTTSASCTKNGNSFVRVSQTDGKYAFSICIGVDVKSGESTSGYKWMDVTSEESLQGDTKAGIKEYNANS
jgi:type IV pilus assembly protein PilA